MSATRNSETTPILISGLFLLFGLILMVAPGILGLDMMQWGFGLIFFGFFVFLTGVISMSIFAVRFRKVKEMLSSDDVIVRWTHREEEFLEQAERSFRAKRKQNLVRLSIMLFFIVVVSAAMVAVAYRDGEEDAMPLFLGIMAAVAGVLIFVALMAPRWDRRRALRNARDTVISERGIYTQGTLYTWGKVAARLRGVSLSSEGGENRLVFSIDSAAQVGVPQYVNHTVEVPVPPGEEAAAEEVCRKLEPLCDAGDSAAS